MTVPTPQFHLDVLGWSRAVAADNLWWGYKGINRPKISEYNWANNKIKCKLVYTLLYDEQYMQGLIDAEAKYYAESEDYKEDWESYVEWVVHRKGCCPEENQEEYDEAFKEMAADESKRYSWAYERVEWDWIADQVKEYENDPEAIAYFLKEHPVDEVYCSESGEWFDLDEIIGYSFCCNHPCTSSCTTTSLSEEELRKIPLHRYTPDCELCPEDSEAQGACVFDLDGRIRDFIRCPSCGETFSVDDLSPEHHRPFDWPPDAPYPPRRGFAGEFMDVPPFERDL